MADRNRIEPPEVIAEVEQYVHRELADAESYSNRTPLDESGIWSLHALAAEVYAMGWKAGETAAMEKERRIAQRTRDRLDKP